MLARIFFRVVGGRRRRRGEGGHRHLGEPAVALPAAAAAATAAVVGAGAAVATATEVVAGVVVLTVAVGAEPAPGSVRRRGGTPGTAGTRSAPETGTRSTERPGVQDVPRFGPQEEAVPRHQVLVPPTLRLPRRPERTASRNVLPPLRIGSRTGPEIPGPPTPPAVGDHDHDHDHGHDQENAAPATATVPGSAAVAAPPALPSTVRTGTAGFLRGTVTNAPAPSGQGQGERQTRRR